MAATTLTAGSIRDLPIRSSGRLTLTPGSGGTITILSRDSSDDTAVPRSISSAETLSLVADSTLSFQAVTADAGYEFFPFDSAANMAWVQSSVSGAGVIATSRAAVSTDSGGTFGMRTGATYTISDTSLIPAGVVLTAGASGGGTLAVGGSVTINGGTASITLTARQVAAVLPTDGSSTDLTVKVS